MEEGRLSLHHWLHYCRQQWEMAAALLALASGLVIFCSRFCFCTSFFFFSPSPFLWYFVSFRVLFLLTQASPQVELTHAKKQADTNKCVQSTTNFSPFSGKMCSCCFGSESAFFMNKLQSHAGTRSVFFSFFSFLDIV